MRFQIEIAAEKMYEAGEMASRFLMNGESLIAAHKKQFTYVGTMSNKDVAADIMRRCRHLSVTVLPWKPFNPFTSAIATTYKDRPGLIYINIRKLSSRNVSDYVATLVHETLHVIGYGHGSNSGQGKEPKLSSVPIAVASIAKEWVGRA